MFFCPFCRTHLPENQTFCPKCGYVVILSLPFRPTIQHKSRYVLLALLSMALGITSCVISLFPYLYVIGMVLVVPAIACGAISLEGIAHKFNGKLIRLFAISGLAFGVLGYIFNVLINSEVGTSSGL